MADSTAPRDLATLPNLLVAATPIGLLIAAGRMAPKMIVPGAAVAAFLCVCFITDRVEGRRRMTLGTLAAVFTWYTAAITWPWHPTYAAILALPLFAVWCIGAGHNKRVIPKAAASLQTIVAQNLPVGVTKDKPEIRGGKLTMMLKAGPNTPRGAMAEFDRKIASTASTKRGTVKLIDLGSTVGEGYYRLECGTGAEPFAQPLKPRPPVGEWPDGMVPIGEYGDGTVCYIGRSHITIGAETGAGKSWLLENVVWAYLMRGWVLETETVQVILLDPKRVAFGKYRNCVGVDAYANEPDEMVAQLARLSDRMDSRYKALELAGRDKWTAADGPFILCVVDETFDLVTLAPDAIPHLVRLYQLGRAAGIQMVCATQRPDAQSIPPLVKANSGTIIGLRVANATAERTLWEDAKDRGIKVNDRKRKDGRAYVDTVGRDGGDVQVYPTPETDGLRFVEVPSGPSVHPITHPPYAGQSGPESPESAPGIRSNRTGPESPDAWALLTQETAASTPAERVLAHLDGDTMSVEEVMAWTGLKRSSAYDLMAKLVSEQRAKKVTGGWSVAQ